MRRVKDSVYETNFKLKYPVHNTQAARDYLTRDDMTAFLIDSLEEEGMQDTASKVQGIEWDLKTNKSGIIVLRTTEDLSEQELDFISDWVSGQNSDGLGEGFEQQSFAMTYKRNQWGDIVGNPKMASFDWERNPYKFSKVSDSQIQNNMRRVKDEYWGQNQEEEFKIELLAAIEDMEYGVMQDNGDLQFTLEALETALENLGYEYASEFKTQGIDVSLQYKDIAHIVYIYINKVDERKTYYYLEDLNLVNWRDESYYNNKVGDSKKNMKQVKDEYWDDYTREKNKEVLNDMIDNLKELYSPALYLYDTDRDADNITIYIGTTPESRKKDLIIKVEDWGWEYVSEDLEDNTMSFVAMDYDTEAGEHVSRFRTNDSYVNRSLGQRIKDSVKMKNIRKRITDAKEKFFNNDLKRMQAYRRVTDSEGKIKEDVVFLIEDGDVLAVFPNTYGTATRDKDTMVCYAHVGQHSSCTYDYANTLKTASESEYKDLYDELTNHVGYNLNVLKSLPSEDELKQNGKEIRDSYIKHKRHAITDERLLARGEEIQYNGKRGTVQYALFHGQQPVVIRWTNEDGSEEFEIPYNQVGDLKIHDSEDDIDANVEPVDNDSEIDENEVTDGCGKKKGKKKTADGVKRVKITKRQTKKSE